MTSFPKRQSKAETATTITESASASEFGTLTQVVLLFFCSTRAHVALKTADTLGRVTEEEHATNRIEPVFLINAVKRTNSADDNTPMTMTIFIHVSWSLSLSQTFFAEQVKR